MSVTDHKITAYTDSIKDLPDRIQGEAAWLKAKFDGRTDKEVKEKHNGLVDEIAENYKTAAATTAEIDQKVTAIGAGDMAMANYDPAHNVLNAGGIPAYLSGALVPIEARAISAYIHAKADTVHTLTGTGENIKFKATADYVAGDTMQIGSTELTIRGNPSFEIGDTVMALLDGSNINFNSGGAGLSVKVVGGTTQPTSPAEDLIWVNTSTAIAKATLGYTKPTVNALGDVFIQRIDASVLKINVNKKYPFEVGIGQVSQWDGSQWVLREAAVYKTSWHKVPIYIYSYGDQCAARGGSWSKTGYYNSSWGSNSNNGGAVTHQADSMLMTASVTSCVVGKDSAINLDAYSKLIVGIKHKIGVQGSGGANAEQVLLLSTSKVVVGGGLGVTPLISSTGTLSLTEIDISGYTGAQYIAIAINAAAQTNRRGEAEVQYIALAE